MVEQIIHQAQNLDPPSFGWDGFHNPAIIKYGTDPVSMTREEPGKSGNQIDQHGPLEGTGAAEIEGGGKVQEKPGSDFPIFHVLPDKWGIHPGRYIPIDIADIIFRLILAQIRKVHAESIEQGAIITLQNSIQPADHLPVKPLENSLRRCGGHWHVHARNGRYGDPVKDLFQQVITPDIVREGLI